MSSHRLKYLLEQYVANSATPAEIRELFAYIKQSKNDATLRQKIKEMWLQQDQDGEFPQVNWDVIFTKIVSTPLPITKRYHWVRYAAAAVVIGALSVGGYFIFNSEEARPVTAAKVPVQLKNELQPGGNKAVLTLANGQQIILDSASNGALSKQGNVQITKLANGQLSYRFLNADPAKQGDPNQTLYNTIATPPGGQYQITLADGSRVWLNAGSSLRFPASFAGKEREVALTGEGYFEVAHDASKPFKVSVRGVEVKVLGTHFNINAYEDESSIRTTLLEGSVRVEDGTANKLIKPGEQARIANNAPAEPDRIAVRKVDVDAVVAWKNGRFIFQDDNIQSIMRQLARWYNVQVSYDGNVTNEEFVGVINRSRYGNISEILEMLERTRTVSFAIVGRHVTVMPYKNKS